MEQIELQGTVRTGKGKKACRDIRKEGRIPAVAYSSGKEAVSLTCNKREFERIIHSHGIGNMVIHLTVTDSDDTQEKTVIIKELQFHPIRGDVLHIDFQEISLLETITVKVPVKLRGEAVGVKRDSGVLDHHLWEIEVECLPTDIPEDIPVQITELQISEAVHIKDITFPDGVNPMHDEDTVVVSVLAPLGDEPEADEEEGEEPAEPEVLRQKTPEEEEK